VIADRAAGIPFSWRPTNAGTVTVLADFGSPNHTVGLCEFDGASGRGEFPADLLSRVQPSTGYLLIRGHSASVVVADDYVIEFRCESSTLPSTTLTVN
jgi:hypothetical protein